MSKKKQYFIPQAKEYDYENKAKLSNRPDYGNYEADGRDNTIPLPASKKEKAQIDTVYNNWLKKSSAALPTPTKSYNPSFLNDLYNMTLSGTSKADNILLSLPKTIWKSASWLTDKLTPDSLYDPKKNLITQGMDKVTNYYSDIANKTDEKYKNVKGIHKALYEGGQFIPQAIATGMELSIPIPKVGNIGKGLEGLSKPVGETVSKVLGSGKLGQYGSKAAKNATEFATLNALTTGANGGSLKDMGKSALEGAGQGALFGVGGKAIGDATHFIKGLGNVKKVSTDGIKTTVKDEAGNTHDINNVIFDNTAKPIENNVITSKTEIKPLEVATDTNKTMPKLQTNRKIDIPKSTQKDVSYNNDYINSLVKNPTEVKSNEIPANVQDFITEQQGNKIKNISKQDYITEQTNKANNIKVTANPTPIDSLPIENRNFENVGNKKIKAYQYLHPEVKQYTQNEANNMLAELQNGIKHERTATTNKFGETQVADTPRVQSDDITTLLNNGYKYKDIEKGLNNIINDNGSENNAAAKKIEVLIHDRLNNGYTHYLTGEEVPANPMYKETVKQLEGNNSKLESNLQTFGMKFDVNTPREAMRDKQDITNFEQRTGNEPQPNDYKERQTIANSFLNSKAIPEEVKQSLRDNPETYKYLEHNNEQAMSKSRDYVDNNYNTAVNHIKNLHSLEDDTDTAMAIEIERKLIQEGKFDEAKDWSLRVAKLGTKSGQAIQYFSTIKRFTPEWTLNHVQKIMDSSLTKEQRDILDKTPKNKIDEIIKKNKIPHMTTEMAKTLNDMANKINELPEGRAKNEAIYKLQRYVGMNVPKPLQNRVLSAINNFQTLSMLSSPKTAVRNVLGNGLFGGIQGSKNIVRTGIDKTVSLVTGKRTSVLPSIKNYAEGFKQGTKENFLDFKNDVDTRDLGKGLDKYELNRIDTSKGFMHQWNRVSKAMISDRPFEGASFKTEFEKQKKLAEKNGVEFNEADAIEKAKKQAAYDTFNDDNKISDLALKLKRGLNGGKEWGLGDILLKFAKTPANIAARAIDYSPVAFGRALKACRQGGKFNQEKFADELSKGLTGAGIISLGYGLNNLGAITTDREKNYDAQALQSKAGLGNFKINVSALNRLMNGGTTNLEKGDLHLSYDWAQPTSVLLALGAELSSKDKNVLNKAENILSSFNNGLNSLIDQPMTQGLQKLFGSNDMAGAAEKLFASIPQTFVPSILNNFKQMMDNQAKETYDPSLVKQGINQAINRIPGLEKKLPDKIDTLGDKKQTFQNGSNNLFNVFLNPAITTRYYPTKEVEKSLNEYNKTGDSSYLPKLADKYLLVKGQKYNLTPTQFNKLQGSMGKGAKDVLNNYNGENIPTKLTQSNSDAKNQMKREMGLPLPKGKDNKGITGQPTFSTSNDTPSIVKGRISSTLKDINTDASASIKKQSTEISKSKLSDTEKTKKLNTLLEKSYTIPMPAMKDNHITSVSSLRTDVYNKTSNKSIIKQANKIYYSKGVSKQDKIKQLKNLYKSLN